MDNINENELKNEIEPIKSFAETLIIKVDSDNIQAADYLRKIKAAQKLVKTKFAPMIEAAYQSHKKLKAFEAEFLNPLDMAESQIKTAMVKFEREAEFERRRLQEAQEQEARRIETEARRLEEQARKAEKKGKEAQAIAKADAAIAVQVKADEVRQTVIATPMTRNAGISYKDNWNAVIKDLSLVPREYLVPNMTALNGLAKATKGTISIPGVEFVNNRTVASRSY